jgi:hypothetical protein
MWEKEARMGTSPRRQVTCIFPASAGEVEAWRNIAPSMAHGGPSPWSNVPGTEYCVRYETIRLWKESLNFSPGTDRRS